jgi:HK97 family phage portal protein
MAIVPVAGGGYQVVRGDPTRPPYGGTPYYAAATSTWMLSAAYAAIYATQINVRKCVDFLARNAAQVGLHVFRRVSDTDRQRVSDHPLAQWLANPNPAMTAYRLIEALMADLALYGQAYWLKDRQSGGRLSLVRLPPQEITVYGGLLPTAFVWTVGGGPVPLPTSDVVPFGTYNPIDPKCGLSLLESLRLTLEEDLAANESRRRYWQNGTRIDGVIQRPREAPKWTPPQKQSFREQLQARHSGPQGTGGVLVLEEGMTFQPMGFSAKDSEYIPARKFSAEEVAALYQIPLPMVGILDHATFSNIKEQHKQMLTDCLGPWFTHIEQGIEKFLLPEAAESADVYVEFNVAEKLKGSFEEQTNGLRVAVGRPFMTANEARARLNLPRMTDDPTADQLAAQQGGPSTGASVDAGGGTPPPDPAAAAQVEPVVRAALARQAARLQKVAIDARADSLNHARCTSELAADLAPLLGRAGALEYAARVTDQTYVMLVERRDPFAVDRDLPSREVPYAP